jgi:hypothetical protein
MSNNLQEIGINVGLIISGLFGSLLTIKKGAANRIGSTVMSVMGGVGSANYLTPVVIDLLSIPTDYSYGIAFLLGFIGLRGIEAIAKKLMPEVVEEPKKEEKND